MAASSFCLEFSEASARAEVPGIVTRKSLPASDDGIDVDRVDLDPAAAPEYRLGLTLACVKLPLVWNPADVQRIH